MKVLLVAVNIAVALTTVAAAYGGIVNPDITPIPAILAMTFPACLIITLLLAITDLLTFRKAALIPLLTIVATLPSISGIIPLNIFEKKANGSDKPSFTMISYNVYHLTDWKKRSEGVTDPDRWRRDADAGLVNPTLSFILHAAPDLGCFQEMPPELTDPARTAIRWKLISQSQADSLAQLFPRRTGFDSEIIMTRFPMRPVTLRQPESETSSFAAAVVNILGKETLVVCAHFESIGLSPEDKELYRELTKGEAHSKRDISRVRHQLLPKLAHAFKARAAQARLLREQIDSIGIHNVIISGDFNDIPGCYAIRTLCGNDFKTAFSEAGTISLPTYHGNRFYFHIDHILYRGDFRAVAYSRPRIPYSDHYPVMATFTLQ